MTGSAQIERIRTELARVKPHTTTLNFIVWIDREENRGWVVQRAMKISEKHPSRTIILDASPGRNDAELRPLDPDDPAHRSTFISIGVAGMSPTEACELADSLRAPEVPAVLCWSAESLGEETGFRCFFRDRVEWPVAIVDSSLGVADDTTIREVVRFYKDHPGVALHDLAWMRLHLWQDIVARFFDDGARREELTAIRRLKIVAGSDAEALYFAGWLASRLGWTASGDAFSDRSGRRVAFEHERGGQARRVYSVALETDTSTYQGVVDDGDPSIVRVWAEGKHAHEPVLAPLGVIDTASLVERAALDERNTDEIFETALRMVQTLLGE